LKRKQQSKRTEKFGDYEVPELCTSIVLRDSGNHERNMQRKQDFCENLLDFYRILTSCREFMSASSSSTTLKKRQDAATKPISHQKTSTLGKSLPQAQELGAIFTSFASFKS
jgi:hypothetical protein